MCLLALLVTRDGLLLVQSKGRIDHGERCRFTTSTGDSFTGRDVLIQEFYSTECQNPVRECA